MLRDRPSLRVDRAVELLEQTRGILITETLDVRDGLGILRDRAPELAAEIVALRDALANLDQIASTPEFDLGAPSGPAESSARVGGTALARPSGSRARRVSAPTPDARVARRGHARARCLRRHPRPHFDRKITRHLAFGYGVHQCLGQNIARAELKTIQPRLFQRFPGLRLAGPLEEVEMDTYGTNYGVRRMLVTW
jgi:hypothetical protein